ncbi:MAG TPA: PH domain-containing protein [Candidatus Paceibacterota bacterium]
MKLDDGEYVVYVVRKHPIVFAGKLLFVLLGALLPAVVIRYMPQQIVALFSTSQTAELMAFAYVLWLLFLWVSLFVMWTYYYLNVLVITNEHVIDVRQGGLFSRELSSARLEKIQDVTVNTEGLIETIFHIGTITIETAGEEENLVIEQAANPERAREAIMNAHSNAAEGKASTAPDSV